MEKLRLIGDYLHLWAREAPKQEALVLNDLRWNYGEFQDQVITCARALINTGVKRGDRVLLLSTPRPEFMIIYLATTEIGAIWGGLSPKSQLDEYRQRLSDARPTVLFSLIQSGDRDYTFDLTHLMKENPQIRRLITLNDKIPGLSTPLDDFLTEGREVPLETYQMVRATVRTEDPAMIVYTSGTTGKPKGALLSHKSLIHGFVGATTYVHLSSPLRIICHLPINHIGAAGQMATFALIAGGAIYYMESFSAEGTLELVQREHINVLGQVPTQFELELALPNFEEYDMSSVEEMLWSGAAASKDMVEKLSKSVKARLATNYGATETSGPVTWSPPDATLEELYMTVGRPTNLYEFKIAEAQGRPVPVGETGEICIRGSVFLGYMNNEEATREAFDPEGWLHTGDLAVSDPKGNIRLVGRIKEMFKSGGLNVYPREIESLLENHGDVAKAVVIGMPDPLFQEVGWAYIMPHPGAELDEEELKAYCLNKVSRYKIPKRFIVREAFPLLPTGKIDKKDLQRQAAKLLEKDQK
jgi:acyl-CoA synthetase (AMP-forming)/AMP-acid ligase II